MVPPLGGGREAGREAALTEVLNSLDVIVAEVQRIQLLQRFQVLDFMNQVHLQVEAAQFGLSLQVLDFLYSIALQPETAQTCVFL